MKFTCNSSMHYGPSPWYGDIYLIRQTGIYKESEIHSRGVTFRIVTGRCGHDNFLYDVSHNFGSLLSNYDDVFWNRERISRFLNPVDTESLVMGLTQVPLLQNHSEQEVISNVQFF